MEAVARGVGGVAARVAVRTELEVARRREDRIAEGTRTRDDVGRRKHDARVIDVAGDGRRDGDGQIRGARRHARGDDSGAQQATAHHRARGTLFRARIRRGSILTNLLGAHGLGLEGKGLRIPVRPVDN